jgi:hypothetical protein
VSVTQVASSRETLVDVDDDICSLASLASELSHRLSRVVSSAQGSAGPHALTRWFARCATPADHQVLATVSGGARLMLIAPATPNVEALARARSREGSLCALLPDPALAVLMPGSPGAVGDDRALRLAKALAADIVRHDRHATVVTSGRLETVLDLHPALQDLRDAGQAAPAERLVAAEERWADIGEVRLARAAQTLVPQVNPVARLLEYDERNGTDLAHTLLLWLEEDGDGAAVARRLHMHVNSVRYRVRRAQDVAGLSISDPTARLLAHILLRSTRGPSRPAPAGDALADSLLPTTTRRPPQ